ncbi:MAG: tRNA-dihydrouridine synthase family protein [Candidatus Muirbacterium halophilum]|nr:tRNA-dihydrouridine synthase family protein [Candidatus Muirbacterium halophilum]MCK9475463.1 tRNA-dihydrouridine synthase family protein [Candidatus Muirbacterium halophilum]
MIKKLEFRGLKFKNNIFTAPLAGYTDIPWRYAMKDSLAGVIFTEMISVEALARDSQKTFDMLEKTNEFNSKSNLCVQLFGNNIESFKKSLEIVYEKFEYKNVNINMGCPVSKVLKSKAGCYYLDKLEEAEKVIKEIRKLTDCVLSIKTRLGINNNDLNGLKLCQIAQNCGVDFVIVHARTFKQGFSGNINIESLAEFKKKLDIPVIGNGDIYSVDDIKSMYNKTNVDGFMIGRGLFGNPNLISEILGEDKKIDTILFFKKHFEYMTKYYGEDKAYRNMKKFVPYYKNLFSKKDKIAILTSLSYYDFIKNLKQTGIIL